MWRVGPWVGFTMVKAAVVQKGLSGKIVIIVTIPETSQRLLRPSLKIHHRDLLAWPYDPSKGRKGKFSK